MKENSKKILIITVLICLLLLITIGVSYAVFVYSKAGMRQNVISTGTLIFTYNETSDGINLNNAMPTSDAIGKISSNDNGNNGYFDFNVRYASPKLRTINYEIYACEDEKNTLDPHYVRVYLTDQNNIPISGYEQPVTYYDLINSQTDNACKRLYYGTFHESDSRDFRLRIWLSDKYEVTPETKTFKIKVNTSAVEG